MPRGAPSSPGRRRAQEAVVHYDDVGRTRGRARSPSSRPRPRRRHRRPSADRAAALAPPENLVVFNERDADGGGRHGRTREPVGADQAGYADATATCTSCGNARASSFMYGARLALTSALTRSTRRWRADGSRSESSAATGVAANWMRTYSAADANRTVRATGLHADVLEARGVEQRTQLLGIRERVLVSLRQRCALPEAPVERVRKRVRRGVPVDGGEDARSDPSAGRRDTPHLQECSRAIRKELQPRAGRARPRTHGRRMAAPARFPRATRSAQLSPAAASGRRRAFRGSRPARPHARCHRPARPRRVQRRRCHTRRRAPGRRASLRLGRRGRTAHGSVTAGTR